MIAEHQQLHMDVNYHAVLEVCLREILSFIKPSADDVLKRQNAIKEIAVAIQSDRSLMEAGAAVKPFGSYISDLYTKWGDLDISIDLAQSKPSPDDRQLKINVLHKIMRALQRIGVANNVEFVRARVPLLVYTSKCCKISCDISINNHAGYVKSCILRWISNTDKRFCEFVLVIKEWAKAQHINDPKTGTLNSYSLCLLIIFHFQTCTPAILPPLKELYEGNIVDGVKGGNTLRHIEASYSANFESYRSKISSRRNQSSLSELLTSFFDKFSGLDTLASDYVICTYTGKWEPINNSKIRWMRKFQTLLIEDPFEKNENAARAVGASGLTEISRVFKAMCRKLSTRLLLADRNSLLSNLLGPEIRSKFDAGRQQIHDRFGTQIDSSRLPQCYFVTQK
ncbi:hypothetical protein KSP39_PZI004162 [Platanthera zijinensis]|uniref:Poly(A) RNA polymerase mitochondrial-like central palm domain-containing protein n=2 Tax=Platanthera zijinensis TaxID=2320716 RepID=A0AAP0BWE5_9ASPA